MRSFDEIYKIAAKRKGGGAALEQLIDKPKTKAALSRTKDDRWLSAMARAIFQAGFSWKVIDQKWPGFEEAFAAFDPLRVSFFSDEDLDRLLADKAIVRNGMKIKSVIENAVFINDIAREHKSFGKFVAAWPDEDYIGLLEVFSKRGARLGGATGPRVLRMMGKASFVLTNDVNARLIAEKVIDKPATSKTAMRAVQSAFNQWSEESGRSLTEISRILAYSTGT